MPSQRDVIVILEDIAGKLEDLATLQGGGDTTALLTAIKNAVDGLEGLITSTNTHVDQLEGYTDGLETLVGATNTAIASANTKLDTLHTDVDGLETLVGATNTAVAGTNTKLGDGTQKAQVVDGSGNVAPVGDTSARAPFTRPVLTTSVDEGQNLALSNTSVFQFASLAATSGVLFQADPGNTGNVHLAYANTVTAGATGKGYVLVPGGAILLPVANANQVFGRATVGGQNVHYLAQ
jgi:hypothetical protein